MRNKETLQKVRESPVYRSMYREIIRTQIQTLIDQLAYTGEESVLLTACIVENDVTENTAVGTELGREFLNQENALCLFKEFCVKSVKDRSPVSQCSSPSKQNVNQPGKRKFSEMNGEDREESSEAEQTTAYLETKRSRSLTPSLKLVREENSIEDKSNSAAVFVPKGYSKCNLCNYMSKFKANVTRHERGVHRINLEGATVVTAHYTCALCEYKSTYRSNLMRHEKSIHKVNSTPAELESRKIHFIGNADDTSVITEVDFVQYETEAVNQTVVSDGDQMFINQTGTNVDNIRNQSFNEAETEEPDILIKYKPVQFNTETENQAVGNDRNQQYLNQNGTDMENMGNRSNTEPVIEECDEEQGCPICNHCHLIFDTISDLRKHVDTTHLITDKFSCEKCDQTFDNDLDLKIHLATHNASKQEVCRCGKAFQYKTSLIRHERKCEFLTTSQENSSQEGNSECSNTETSLPCVSNESTQNVTESDMRTIERAEKNSKM